jgi:hypothetical protein
MKSNNTTTFWHKRKFTPAWLFKRLKPGNLLFMRKGQVIRHEWKSLVPKPPVLTTHFTRTEPIYDYRKPHTATKSRA